MGIAHYHRKGNDTLAIWKITEDTDQLYELAMLNDTEKTCYDSFNSETRKKEWLAVRVLTCKVLNENIKIAYHDSGAPYLINSTLQISISHTTGYIAIFTSNIQCGIDIELKSRNFEKASKKYIGQAESEITVKSGIDKNLILGIIWCAKEAAYKADASLNGASFLDDIIATNFQNQTVTLNCIGHEISAKVEVFDNCIICIVKNQLPNTDFKLLLSNKKTSAQ